MSTEKPDPADLFQDRPLKRTTPEYTAHCDVHQVNYVPGGQCSRCIVDQKAATDSADRTIADFLDAAVVVQLETDLLSAEEEVKAFRAEVASLRLRYDEAIQVIATHEAFAAVAKAQEASDAAHSVMAKLDAETADAAVRPAHYQKDGKECIDEMEAHFAAWWAQFRMIERMAYSSPQLAVIAFCVLSSFKYKWRAGLKPGESGERDLSKARFYDAYALFLLDQGPDPRVKP
jgi:hypothetical protein